MREIPQPESSFPSHLRNNLEKWSNILLLGPEKQNAVKEINKTKTTITSNRVLENNINIALGLYNGL